MTIEEKARAYDEALERAKGIHHFSSDIAEIKRMEQIFPELAESKDEKIRKELVAVINDLILPDEQLSRFNAWLEKQGNKTEEYIFCPIAGCAIDEAARQAIYKVANGENIVFSFNGFYMKIYKDTTIDNIINSYNDFCKKQGKQKWTEEDSLMTSTLMRDIDQITYVNEEGKNKRINWLKSIKQRLEEQQ